jgi:hypothetical protein
MTRLEDAAEKGEPAGCLCGRKHERARESEQEVPMRTRNGKAYGGGRRGRKERRESESRQIARRTAECSAQRKPDETQ